MITKKLTSRKRVVATFSVVIGLFMLFFFALLAQYDSQSGGFRWNLFFTLAGCTFIKLAYSLDTYGKVKKWDAVWIALSVIFLIYILVKTTIL